MPRATMTWKRGIFGALGIIVAGGLATLIDMASTPMASAQTVVSGEIAGTVTDPSGASVGNAKVTLKSDATGETQIATTTAVGQFRFPLLRPGVYALTTAAAGFAATTQKSTVSLGQISNVTIALSLQTQAEAVNVSEVSGLIQVDNANLATTFDTNQLLNLPAPGNDMTSYALSAPGVTVSTGAGYGNFSAFGLPGVSNLFTINGSDNMDPYLNLNNSGASNLTLGSNELQEAAVVLNGYTGQYGRQAGAQVNYVTKSGSNEFHGNATWQYNGRPLNANDWFNNATGTPRPFAVSNEWSDSFGGPIVKNKAFFFFDNEGLRYVLPSGGPVYFPTTNFASYVLSHLTATNPTAVPLYQTAFNLYAGASGAARAVPVTNSFDPFVAGTSGLGCGDFSGTAGWGTGTQACARTFQSTVNNLNTEWLLAGRVDYNPTNSDRLYFRYNMDRGVQATGTDPINAAFNANSVQPSYGGQMGYTKTIGAASVNTLLLSASYYSAIFGPPDFAGALKVFPTTWAFNDGLYSSNNATGTSLGGEDQRYPQGRKVRQWQLIDDFSKILGAHDFKVGLNYRKNFVSTYAALPNTSGLFTFNSMTDFVNASLDNGSLYNQSFVRVGAEPLSMYSAGFYVQDEWRARSNLTLTLALRFDRNSNIHCYPNCFTEFAGPFGAITHDATIPYSSVIHTGIADAFPSVESIVPEPRVGVAYSITKSTVVRGGFGIFSDLYQGLLADRFITNSPAVATFTADSGVVALNNPSSAFAVVANSNTAFQNGFNTGATVAQLRASVPGFAPPTFNTIAPQLSNPKYDEWNVEVQHSFGSKYMLSVNYVGNHGWDEFNQFLFANTYTKAGFTMPGTPTSAPDSRFAEIRETNNVGYSNYHGLVSSFKWRVGSQFSGQFAYAWSHAQDTCSNACFEPFNLNAAPSIRYQIAPNGLRSINYSSSDYDVRHTVSANYVYNTPTERFSNRILKHVLGGWTAAGVVFFHGGYPFSVVNSGVRSLQLSNATGIANQSILADWIGGSGYPTCSTPNVACLTTSQFAVRASQHDYGNLPRNSFRGPGYFDTDLNVNKTFSYRERYKLVVGAYFFNILNHPNFDNPFNNLATGTFGQILETVSGPSSAYGSFQGSAVSGRVVQTTVRFMF